MAFRYALQNMTEKQTENGSAICLSLTDRFNFCGIVFRGLAASQAVVASNDVSVSSQPQFTAALDLSRKFASYQLICECTSLFVIMIYICFHLYKKLEARAGCMPAGYSRHSNKPKPDVDLVAKTKSRWSKNAVIVVAITFFIRFVFTVPYTAASETYITDDCKDPCGSCQSALALIWSWNVFAPHVRVAVVFISGPLVVIWVLFCMNKVHNAKNALSKVVREVADVSRLAKRMTMTFAAEQNSSVEQAPPNHVAPNARGNQVSSDHAQP